MKKPFYGWIIVVVAFLIGVTQSSPTSPVSKEIQKNMVIFRVMSFVGC